MSHEVPAFPIYYSCKYCNFEYCTQPFIIHKGDRINICPKCYRKLDVEKWTICLADMEGR